MHQISQTCILGNWEDSSYYFPGKCTTVGIMWCRKAPGVVQFWFRNGRGVNHQKIKMIIMPQA